MTGDPPERKHSHGTPAMDSQTHSPSDSSLSFVDILKEAGQRIGSDPMLALPFVIAGFVVAVADGVRRVDPLPFSRPDWFAKAVSIQFSLFPSGTARTLRESGSLVDLRVPYVLGVVSLETIVFLAVGVAGWVTIARVVGTEHRFDSLGRYLGVVLLVSVVPGLFGDYSVTFDALPLAVLALVVWSLVVVRLFSFPGFLVKTGQIRTALERSVRTSQGAFWSLLSLVIVFGVGNWVLTQVPIIGSLLSTAIVAPFHAVSIAIVIDHQR